jgi:hypothetical protein
MEGLEKDYLDHDPWDRYDPSLRADIKASGSTSTTTAAAAAA